MKNKKLDNTHSAILQTGLGFILQKFNFEKGLSEVIAFLKKAYQNRHIFYNRAGLEFVNTQHLDRLFIFVLVQNANAKLQENQITPAKQCALDYIKDVMVPAIRIQEELEELEVLIFDNAYWQSKGCIPTGIRMMQTLFLRKHEEVEALSITALRDIVFNRPGEKDRKFWFFTPKRNPITCKFYQIINASHSWKALLNSKIFKEILDDRIAFNREISHSITVKS